MCNFSLSLHSYFYKFLEVSSASSNVCVIYSPYIDLQSLFRSHTWLSSSSSLQSTCLWMSLLNVLAHIYHLKGFYRIHQVSTFFSTSSISPSPPPPTDHLQECQFHPCGSAGAPPSARGARMLLWGGGRPHVGGAGGRGGLAGAPSGLSCGGEGRAGRREGRGRGDRSPPCLGREGGRGKGVAPGNKYI